MAKRPKRDLRRRWQLREDAAEQADARGATPDSDDRFLILDRDQLWAVFTRYGIAQLGRTKLKQLGVEAIQLRRLKPRSSTSKPGERRVRGRRPSQGATVSLTLMNCLLQGVRSDLREAAEREIGEWVIDEREQLLLRHSKAWALEFSGAVSPVQPRVARFDGERNHVLVFDPADSQIVRERKEAEFMALMRRIGEVVQNRSRKTIGDVFERLRLMNWRQCTPLLQWEESGFTERHWSELTDDELLRFVKAGDERERILANRADDLTRVRLALRDRKPQSQASNSRAGSSEA